MREVGAVDMNYKKIIANRKTREKILRCLSFIPDRHMITLQYRIKTGRKLNLKTPCRYTEKLQWYKLYYRNPKMIQCVDKYDVRDYIEKAGFGELLNECYGVYDDVDDIDFNKLPNEFVIKDTLGGGGNRVIICTDKAKFNWNETKERLRKWVEEPLVKFGGREWPYYSGKKHRILIEKYLPGGENGLVDYKFMCFDGRVEVCYVLADRELGVSVKEGICDRDLSLLPYMEVGDEIPDVIRKPDNYNEMLTIAEKISKAFPHVRVDLYNVDGRIIFGEMTFFDSSGYALYEPDEFDFIMGKYFHLPKISK